MTSDSFDFSYDPTLFSHPPPLPPSSDLFSPSETTHLLGFLDNFSDIAWDFGVPDFDQDLSQPPIAPYSNPHLNTTPDPSTSSRLRSVTTSGSVRRSQDVPQFSSPNSTASTSSPGLSTPNISSTSESTVRSPSRPRPLLSTPQKRLNHIMSEQKRRNAIRDGYAQLISLLAPAGAPGIDMPTRGRPKGSGTHAKGQTKGKSGVLFRAVEYCRWLEEGRDALRSEVLRVESAAGMPPVPLPEWPIPRLQLHIEDMEHQGVEVFLNAVNPKIAMQDAVMASFTSLYTPETVPHNVKQITLVLKPMDGVAMTCGSESEKVIHFSLDYINRSKNRAGDEIMGVLVHEVVHCYQFDARHTCPGGLIEGIADFVRLHENLDPPHWKKGPGEKWDDGYEKTAYFLDWIEHRYGDGTIRELNESMRDSIYHRRIFKNLTGRSLRKLWVMYCRSFEGVADQDSDATSAEISL